MSTIEIPLFPLRTVLFPGGFLSLRIFEQRYLTMVRDCAREDSGFGVCLIREGEEAVSPVKTAELGTHAQIVDWYTLEDGLLGVSVVGTIRFMIESSWQQNDGLFRADVRVVPEPPPCTLPENYSVLGDVLSRFMEKVGHLYPDFRSEQLDDAVWVGYRLSELLPLAGIERQHLLELTDPIERLQKLLELLPRFQTG
ncbi:MAG: LON peptidase substrate-binding domain-containing protein [Lysobacterales bacterium]|jgi:Lon protease-like protein